MCPSFSLLTSVPVDKYISTYLIHDTFEGAFGLFQVLFLFSCYRQCCQHFHTCLPSTKRQVFLYCVHLRMELLDWRIDVFSTLCSVFSQMFIEVAVPPAMCGNSTPAMLAIVRLTSFCLRCEIISY